MSMHPFVSIVVAVSQNGVIGRDGDLPWRLSSDLKRFKQLTLGKPVIMGRKTYDSIGRPLPGRPNIVITRNGAFSPPGVIVAASLDEALAAGRREAEKLGVDEVCIIGCGDIYRQAIDLADVLHVTEVASTVEGDTHFPEIDPHAFVKAEEEHLAAGEKDSHSMCFVTWRRNNARLSHE